MLRPLNNNYSSRAVPAGGVGTVEWWNDTLRFGRVGDALTPGEAVRGPGDAAVEAGDVGPSMSRCTVSICVRAARCAKSAATISASRVL